MDEKPETPVEQPSFLDKLKDFLFHNLWTIDLDSLPRWARFGIRMLRIVQMVIKGVRNDEIPLRASALTYSTLIALVPILSIAFSIFKGMGGDKQIDRLQELSTNMPDAFQDFVTNTINVVETTNYGALTGIGVAVVFLIVIHVLGSIEAAFNRIWGITTSRSFVRKVTNYISVVVVVPVLIMSASALSATLKIPAIIDRLGPAISMYQNFLWPLLATWLGLAFLYMFMPNTKVSLFPALIGGLMGGLLFLGWQKLYISVQLGVSNAGVIYGTFASIPIFLAWLYVSWVIILLGAEVTFAVQNSSTFELERAAPRASTQSKLLLALSLATRAATSLKSDVPPLNAFAFSQERKVSFRLINEIIGLFERFGYLAEMADRESNFIWLKTPENVKVQNLIDMVMKDGTQPEELGLNHLSDDIQQVLQKVEGGVSKALEDLTLADLLPASTDHAG